MEAIDFIRKCRNDIVFFAEHVVRSEDGSFYKLEPHQKAMVTSKEGQVVYFCGRRLGKSFMLAVEALHKALFKKYQRVFVLSPTENQAKELAETMIFDGKSGSLPSKDALKKHWSSEEKKKFKATVSVLKKNGITAAGYSGCIWCIEKCNPLYDYCFYLELGDYGGGPKNFINTFGRIAVAFN